MPNYFAFGSNMSAEIMVDRCPSATVLGPARLDGYLLAFRVSSARWGGYAADISEDPSAFIWGVLWKVSDADLVRLDELEGNYRRKTVPVETVQRRRISSVTYMSKLESRSVGGGSPTFEYLSLMVEGSIHHGIPPEYVAFIRSHDTKP